MHELGQHLPAVAARTGWSTQKLRSVLTDDHTAFVSDTGRVFYRENDLPAQATTAGSSSATTYQPIYPTSDTFKLHSHPGSTHKIFLDFDGATVSNTAWNGTGTGHVPNGTHTGFDLDGHPTTFSTAEHGFIQQVWRAGRRGLLTLRRRRHHAGPRAGRADPVVVLRHDLRHARRHHRGHQGPREPLRHLPRAGLGRHLQRVDSGGYYQTAWVFDYDKTFDPIVIGQAAAHETGHTLGLSHDGTSTSPYYDGTSAWGPIMGAVDGPCSEPVQPGRVRRCQQQAGRPRRHPRSRAAAASRRPPRHHGARHPSLLRRQRDHRHPHRHRRLLGHAAVHDDAERQRARDRCPEHARPLTAGAQLDRARRSAGARPHRATPASHRSPPAWTPR